MIVDLESEKHRRGTTLEKYRSSGKDTPWY